MRHRVHQEAVDCQINVNVLNLFSTCLHPWNNPTFTSGYTCLLLTATRRLPPLRCLACDIAVEVKPEMKLQSQTYTHRRKPALSDSCMRLIATNLLWPGSGIYSRAVPLLHIAHKTLQWQQLPLLTSPFSPTRKAEGREAESPRPSLQGDDENTCIYPG